MYIPGAIIMYVAGILEKMVKEFWQNTFVPCIKYIEVTSWLVSADDFSSRVARGANERVSAANE